MLFGSRARGDFTNSSDYDVLVVGDEIPKDPRKVPNELYLKVMKMFPG
ncbi:nucleotidyltransferase domain-containing protein [Acidianus ambivalens]